MTNQFVNLNQLNQYQIALLNGGKSHSNLYPYLVDASILDFLKSIGQNFLKSIGQNAVNLYRVVSKNIRVGAGR